jgi:hypothetical protein
MVCSGNPCLPLKRRWQPALNPDRHRLTKRVTTKEAETLS